MKTVVRILLALAIATLACSAFAEEKCTTWHPGAAPFAKSEAEAMKKLPWELQLWVSLAKVTAEEAVLIEKHIRAHPEGDVPLATIVKGQHFDWMASGEVKRPLISNLCFDPAYAEKNRDGKPVAYTALVGPQWTVQLPTRMLLITRPNRCYNWAGKWLPKPVAPPTKVAEECRTVEYTVLRGDKVRFAVLARKRLPASACWQLCDGDTCSAPPSPCDEPCDWFGPKSVIPTGFEPLHSGWYVAMAPRQSLRFPREVTSEYIALCVEREGLGESDSWIIQPSAWVGGVIKVIVPYGGQPWPAWGQVDMSRWRKP